MQEIEESKKVVSIFSNWSQTFSSENRKVSIDSLKKLFISAASENDSVEYCLASVLNFLQNPLSFSKSKTKMINGRAFSYREPSEENVKEIQAQYRFSCRSSDLYLEIPDYKPFYKKYL